MKALISGLVLLAFGATAKADDLTIAITNSSAQVISSLMVTPMGAETASTENILAASISAGETADITVTGIGDACVFDLRFEFAGEREMIRPDVDLCQTEALIVE